MGKKEEGQQCSLALSVLCQQGWLGKVLSGYPASSRQDVKLAQPSQLGSCQARKLRFSFSKHGFSGRKTTKNSHERKEKKKEGGGTHK